MFKKNCFISVVFVSALLLLTRGSAIAAERSVVPSIEAAETAELLQLQKRSLQQYQEIKVRK